ncbi:pre-mRNA-splicing factor of RES complex [Nitzschia inconspicua]|uniref:Pre-mRNA-splicing factor of RES complex n=1 Tax=Nitzschia inconspicua TaxID=303405 RepID=A0A9K3M2N8_9STRA|nr:pre-mRNA-splicing factor of RES complex [Nitzschia inconspicua]
MPSSKLDYLSKYTSASPNDDDKKERKKKTKKKKKKSKQAIIEQTTALHDDSDNELPLSKQTDDDDEDIPLGIDEDEGPVIVNSADVTNAVIGDAVVHTTATTLGVRQEIDLETGAVSTIPSVRINPGESSDRGVNRPRRPDSSPEQSENSDQDDHRQHRRRYDSDSSQDDHRRSETSIRRHRHDSDVEDSDAENDKEVRPLSTRRRHDSDAEESKDEKTTPDLAKSSHRRRRHYDSDSEEEREGRKPDAVQSFTRRRHDSEDDDNSDQDKKPIITKSLNGRRRHDSDSDDDSDDDSEKRMSSGHKAGLQHYSDFNESEKKIQKRKRDEAKVMVDRYGMGETVYRDKEGRKTDGPPDTTKNGGNAASRVKLDPEAQRRLNQGKVQQEAREMKAREMAILQESAFARHDDDERLEELRKNEIREEDPMAHYAAKKQKKSAPKHGDTIMESTKPIYKGPPPKPNRYGIRPGYRWDGVDRGNGFEDKILAQKYSTKQKEEQAYRWRSADM